MLMLPGWGGWSKCEGMQTEKKGPGYPGGVPWVLVSTGKYPGSLLVGREQSLQ